MTDPDDLLARAHDWVDDPPFSLSDPDVELVRDLAAQLAAARTDLEVAHSNVAAFQSKLVTARTILAALDAYDFSYGVDELQHQARLWLAGTTEPADRCL